MTGRRDWAEFAEAGNLMSCGPNARAYDRRVAGHVDRLVRGSDRTIS